MGLRAALRPVRAFAKRILTPAPSRGPVVLCYHRVENLRLDPQLLASNPAHFEEQLRVLKRDYHPLSLKEMVVQFKAGTLRSDAVAVTFDDGFIDNLEKAKPLLEKYEIPATVFVATGFVEHQVGFMPDTLEQIFLGPHALPSSVSISLGKDKVKQLDLEGLEEWSTSQSVQYENWNVQLDPPTKRHRAYLQSHDLLKELSPTMRRDALESLSTQTGVSQVPLGTNRPMTWAEVKQLTGGGLIDVEGHTRWHPKLPNLDRSEQFEELDGCRKDLQERVGIVSEIFAYPYGSYSDLTISAASESGFKCSLVVDDRQVAPTGDAHKLSRVLIRNWNGNEFAGRLGRISGTK